MAELERPLISMYKVDNADFHVPNGVEYVKIT